MVRAWSAWVLGPSAWALHLSVAYGLVPWLCGPPADAWLHLVSVAALLIAVIGVVFGWLAWRGAGEEGPVFVATTGLMLSGLSVFGVVMQAIPGFMLSPCLGG